MTKYHVANASVVTGASDSNNGLYPTDLGGGDGPLATLTGAGGLQTKMAAGGPEDEFLLGDGCLWNEMLTMQIGGVEGGRVKLGRFAISGQTTPPTITGAKTTATGDWADQGSNIWTTTLTGITADLEWVYFGNILGLKQALVGSVSALYQWHFNTSTSLLTVYATSNPVTLYGSLRPVVLDNLVKLNEKDWLHINGILLRDWGAGGALPGAIYGVKVAGIQTGCLIDYCRFDNFAAGLDDHPAIKAYNFNATVKHCDFARVGYAINQAGPGTIIAHSNRLLACTYGFGSSGGGVITYGRNLCYGVRQLGAGDAIDDGGNIENQDVGITDPVRYTGLAKMNISVDDLGGQYPTKAWLEAAIKAFHDLGETGPSVGVVCNGEYAATELNKQLLRKYRDWGVELCNHSWSHEKYAAGTHTAPIGLTYTEEPTTATVTIGSNTLTTTIDGGGDLSVSLTHTIFQNTSWSGPNGNGEFTATLNTEPPVVVVNGTSITRGTAGSLAAGEWDWAANVLYIKTAPRGSTVQAGHTVGTLLTYLNAQAGYTAVKTHATLVHDNTPAQHLADCTGEDINGVEYELAWNQTNLLTAQVKEAHDYLVEAGITPSKVFILPHGDQSEALITILKASANGAYEAARLAYATSYGNLSRGVDPYYINCVFIEESAYPTREAAFNLVRTYAAWAQAVGSPIVFFTHAPNFSSGDKLGWFLEAIQTYGEYATLEEISDYVRGLTELTTDRAFVTDTVAATDWAPTADSPGRGAGNPPSESYVDIAGEKVDPYAGVTDIGAQQYQATGPPGGAGPGE